MRITLSTVLCAAAVLALFVSGDEPGDGLPTHPHPDRSSVYRDIDTSQAGAELARTRGYGTALVATGFTDNRDKPLPARCVALDAPPVPGTGANYTRVLDALEHDGWYLFRRFTAHGYEDTRLAKGGWTLTVSRPVAVHDPLLDTIVFAAVDTAC
jgi:hypothetical protein